ncbi:hypothetical protein Tco_1344244 [Tanacetum coccineum]
MIDQVSTALLATTWMQTECDDSHTSGTGGRRTERVARECTYQDFMKCKPLYFKGTKGVVELTQWFERMEIGAITWSNFHVYDVIHDVSYAMTSGPIWRKKMTARIGTTNVSPRTNSTASVLGCFPKESDKIKRYVSGLPDMIYGNIVASKPKTMQEAVEMATELMDKKVNTIAER